MDLTKLCFKFHKIFYIYVSLHRLRKFRKFSFYGTYKILPIINDLEGTTQSNFTTRHIYDIAEKKSSLSISIADREQQSKLQIRSGETWNFKRIEARVATSDTRRSVSLSEHLVTTWIDAFNQCRAGSKEELCRAYDKPGEVTTKGKWKEARWMYAGCTGDRQEWRENRENRKNGGKVESEPAWRSFSSHPHLVGLCIQFHFPFQLFSSLTARPRWRRSAAGRS